MKNKKASRLNTWCLFSIVALHKPAGYDQLFLRPALFSSRSDTISIKENVQPVELYDAIMQADAMGKIALGK